MRSHTSLCLTRKPRESVVIGDDVTVEITAVDGDRVRLRITAPVTTRIDRAEVRRARLQDQQQQQQ